MLVGGGVNKPENCMHYIVDVQPWLRIAQPNEEVVSIDTELGRRFVVEAKNPARAIARVTRDVVTLRKATSADLIQVGKSGEPILSEDDPEPVAATPSATARETDDEAIF
jgi:hypothetical protein